MCVDRARGSLNMFMETSAELLSSTTCFAEQQVVSPRWLSNDMPHRWPFRSLPAIKLHRRPRRTIGSLWLPIHVRSSNHDCISRLVFERPTTYFSASGSDVLVIFRHHTGVATLIRGSASSTGFPISAYSNRSFKARRFLSQGYGSNRRIGRMHSRFA